VKLSALLLAAALLAPAQSPWKNSGPQSLVIQYRCTLAGRPNLREALRSEGLASLEDWKSRGIVASYHLLFSRYVDTNNWDLLAIVNFRGYDDAVRWKEVETRRPAGLPPQSLATIVSVATYPTDLVRLDAPETAPPAPAWLVIPYNLTVAPDAYLRYFDEYVKPQLAGWKREGILAGYALYMQRYTAARPWDAMLVLLYKDDSALGQRERVVAKTRAELASDPRWLEIANSKQSVRTEKEAIVADEIIPARQ